MAKKPTYEELEQRVIELHPEQKALIASGFSETERVKETQRLGAGAHYKQNVMSKD